MEPQDQQVTAKLQAPQTPRRRRNPRREADKVFDAKNLSIYYGSFRAVTDVSLSVYQNEITAFIGPSGCGKTTVLRTLNRMNDLIASARVEGDVHYRGASLYHKDVSGDGRAPAHRHGLPEAEPVPEVDLRERRLRSAYQRHQEKSQLDEIVERSLRQAAVGRGEGPAEASRA
jgi:ABC-type phosphate transport system, ATPase component